MKFKGSGYTASLRLLTLLVWLVTLWLAIYSGIEVACHANLPDTHVNCVKVSLDSIF